MLYHNEVYRITNEKMFDGYYTVKHIDTDNYYLYNDRKGCIVLTRENVKPVGKDMTRRVYRCGMYELKKIGDVHVPYFRNEKILD